MIKAYSFFALSLLLSTTALGASKSSISRGGFGFLYADTNHFNNPGLFSQLRGFAIAGDMEKNLDTDDISTSPSVVYGNGRVGLGVTAQRTGPNPMNPGTSTVSAVAGFCFNFAKNMAMVGVGYERSIDGNAPNDGLVSGTITYQPTGKGFSIGGGYSMTINADTDVKAAIGALGYAFNPMVQVEGTFAVNDLTDMTDYTIGGFLNITGRILYVTGGFTMENLSTEKTAMARLGFVLGNAVDISGYGSKLLVTGSEYNVGGVFRLRL